MYVVAQVLYLRGWVQAFRKGGSYVKGGVFALLILSHFPLISHEAK